MSAAVAASVSAASSNSGALNALSAGALLSVNADSNNTSLTSSSSIAMSINNTINSISKTMSLTHSVSPNIASTTSLTAAAVAARMSPAPKQQQQSLPNGPSVAQQQLHPKQNIAVPLSSTNDPSLSSLKTIAQEAINRAATDMDNDLSSLSAAMGMPLNADNNRTHPHQQQQQQQLQQHQQQQQAFSDNSGSNANGPLSSNNSNNPNKGGSTNEAHIPPLLGVAPLGPTPLTKDHQVQFQLMEAAFYHLPTPNDSERLRTYLQRQPVQTPAYYPQVI